MRLSPVTNETLIYSCHWISDNPSTLSRPPSFKKEEGEGNGTSVCPESPGLHAAYIGWYNGLQLRDEEPIPKTSPGPD